MQIKLLQLLSDTLHAPLRAPTFLTVRALRAVPATQALTRRNLKPLILSQCVLLLLLPAGLLLVPLTLLLLCLHA